MATNNETEKNYYAGLFDGEGCVYLSMSYRKRGNRPYIRFSPCCRIGMKKNSRHMLDGLHKFFEVGNIYVSNRGLGNEIHSWQTSKIADTEMFLKYIRPYLRLKHEQADKMLKICELMKTPEITNRNKGLPTRDKETLLKIIRIGLDLNTDTVQTKKLREVRNFEYWKNKVEEVYGYREKHGVDKGGMPPKYSDEQILEDVRFILENGYEPKRDRNKVRRAKYRFGSWDYAVDLANGEQVVA